MTKLKQGLLYLGFAVFALGAGFLLRMHSIESHKAEFLASEASKQGAEKILGVTMSDIHGEQQTISQWQGNVLVINFWATWCAPCREEIPEFMELHDEYSDQGLFFVGIAIDRKEKVIAYSNEFAINYPVLIGNSTVMTLAEETGNPQSALPYTIVINRDGEIVNTFLGRLHKEKLEKTIIPLL